MSSKLKDSIKASLEADDTNGIDQLAAGAVEPVVTTPVEEVVAAVVDNGAEEQEVEVEVGVLSEDEAEEVVVDNSDSLEEAVVEADEAEEDFEEDGDQAEVLEEAAAGLESIREMLIANTAPDAAFLEMANVSVEAYCGRIGLSGQVLSVESYNQTLSVEKISDHLKNIWTAIVKFLVDMKEKVMVYLRRLFTATGRLQKRGEKLNALKLTGTPSSSEITVRGLARRLAVGTKVQLNPERGIQELIKTIRSCIKWDKDVAAETAKIHDSYVKAVSSSNPSVALVFKPVSDIGAPVGFEKIDDSYRWGWRSPVLPGNVRFTGYFERNNSGLVQIGDREMLVGGRIVKEQESVTVADDSTIKVLSAAEIQATSKAIAGLVRVIREAEAVVEANLRDTKKSFTPPQSEDFREHFEAQKIAIAYRKMNALPGQLTGKVIAHAVSVASAYLELAERSAVRYSTAKSSNESIAYSAEGIKGALVGFLTGTAANAVGAVTFGASRAAHGAAFMNKRENLKKDILQISDRIATLRNGNVEEALKDGIKIKKEDREPIDKSEVAKAAVLGYIVPFYGTYQGHKAEELQKELASKIAELKMEFAKAGVTV